MRRIAALAICGLVLAGCGNDVTADVNGSTAITVDAKGNPVVLVAVCHSTIDEVTIFADREGLKEDEENKLLGTWSATSPQEGLVTLALAAPGSGWKTTSTFAPSDTKGYIVAGAQAKADVETSQVFIHGSDLAGLTPDDVLVGDAEVQKRATFEKSCATDESK